MKRKIETKKNENKIDYYKQHVVNASCVQFLVIFILIFTVSEFGLRLI